MTLAGSELLAARLANLLVVQNPGYFRTSREAESRRVFLQYGRLREPLRQRSFQGLRTGRPALESGRALGRSCVDRHWDPGRTSGSLFVVEVVLPPRRRCRDGPRDPGRAPGSRVPQVLAAVSRSGGVLEPGVARPPLVASEPGRDLLLEVGVEAGLRVQERVALRSRTHGRLQARARVQEVAQGLAFAPESDRRGRNPTPGEARPRALDGAEAWHGSDVPLDPGVSRSAQLLRVGPGAGAILFVVFSFLREPDVAVLKRRLG